MFKSILFVLDKEYPLLDVYYDLKQKTDRTGRPSTRTFGGKIYAKLAATGDDSILYEAMFSQTQMIKGKIRFYRRDGIRKAFDLEFANAFVIHLKESFNNNSKDPLFIEIVISPLIQKIRGTIFELPSNPNNPFIDQVAPIEREDIKKILACYITDIEGNEIEEYEDGQKIILNIETENRVGESISISLEDLEHDFKYQGVILENDIIRDLVISSNHEQIELEVVPEQETTQET